MIMVRKFPGENACLLRDLLIATHAQQQPSCNHWKIVSRDLWCACLFRSSLESSPRAVINSMLLHRILASPYKKRLRHGSQIRNKTKGNDVAPP